MKQTFVIILMAITFGVSGQPKNDSSFFPIAVWLQNPSLAYEYKKAGVNLYIGNDNVDAGYLNTLRFAGMKLMCKQNAYALAHLNDTLFYGWTQQDEPDNAQWNSVTKVYDSCINPSVVIGIYDTARSKDTTRPVYLNLGMGVAYTIWSGRGPCEGKINMYPVNKNGYLKGCDIASFDIYPVNSSDGAIRDNLWYVAKGIDSLKSWTNNAKPVWTWIETTQIDAGSLRKPTPQEVRSEVWIALIHGVKGFGYFCHSWVPSFDEAAMYHDTAMYRGISEINHQVAALAPVLNSANTTGFASVSSSNTSVPVDMMTKHYHDTNYIFAVAMRKGTTTATFSVDSGKSAIVLGENRTLKIENGSFTDTFTPYAAHLYKISSAEYVSSEPLLTVRVNVYPNPAGSLVNVDLPSDVPGSHFCLIDTQGRICLNVLVQPGLNSVTLGSDLSGTYIYTVTDASGNRITSGEIIINNK